MSHSHRRAPSSANDTSSPRSWAPVPSQQQAFYSRASVASSWGTVASDAPPPKIIGTPTTFSFESPAPSVGSPWGSGTTGPSRNADWPADRPPSGYSSVVLSSRPTLVNGHGSSFPSSPAQPGPGPVAINPCLNIRDRSRALCIDLARRPSTNNSEYNFHPDLPHSAFRPDMTYADIVIPLSFDSRWVVSVHSPHALTVYDVLLQVQHFLQQSEGRESTQPTRLRSSNPNMNDYREQNTSPHTYREGVKRLDLLSPRRFCIGFEPEVGSNSWIMHLSASPQ